MGVIIQLFFNSDDFDELEKELNIQINFIEGKSWEEIVEYWEHIFYGNMGMRLVNLVELISLELGVYKPQSKNEWIFDRGFFIYC